jgi:glucose/arabinose dehydrogenase
VGLAPGAETTVRFDSVVVPDLDPGEYTYGVHSADDRTTSTLTVEGPENDEPVSWRRDVDWQTDPVGATDWRNYDITRVVSVDNLMSMDIAPDGRIFYITRGAPFVTLGHGTMAIGWVDPDSGESGTALERRVQVGSLEEPESGVPARELGGQAVALDPDFAENGYVYVYYTPAADGRDPIENPYEQFYDGDVTTGYMVVSRFEFREGRLVESTETELLRIIDQQDYCCHRGGNLQFGPDGCLYITTGDNGGGPGIDDRQTSHPSNDASRTSANTADLRGSVLRIKPDSDGSYTVPAGNLKEHWEGETGESFTDAEFRPEIYAMGFRNPFIVSLDEHTGTLFVGDYGPGGQWDIERGPVGVATWHALCKPAFAGWPLFKGYYPYRRYDYENDEPEQPFWQDNPRNTSRNNTGIQNLPPVTPATVWQGQDYERYDGDSGDEGEHDDYVEGPPWLDMPRPGEVTWPGTDTGGSANAGPTYRYSESFGEPALDPYFEGKQFLMAPWGPDRWIGYLTYDRNGTIRIDDFLPDHSWEHPTEMKFGPDGRLFVMDYSHSGQGGVDVVEYWG